MSSGNSFTKRTAKVARKGMQVLLGLHNDDELGDLCDSLRLDMMPSKEQTIDAIFAQKLTTFEDYRHVLSFMWEGVITEYLKLIGKRVSNFRQDPRVAVLGAWLEDTRYAVKGFSRVYVPVTTKRSDIKRWQVHPTDKKVLGYLKALNNKEMVMKKMERALTSSDYRTVLIFYRIIAEVRLVEEKFREYMLSEILRAQKSEADAIKERNRTQKCFDVQNGIMADHLEASETERFTQSLYYDMAMDATYACSWHQKQQKHLVDDIYDYDREINDLKEELRKQKLKYHILYMRHEDLSEEHRRLVHKLDVVVPDLQRRLNTELQMSQTECSRTSCDLRNLEAAYQKYKLGSNEEIERLSMNVEECNQRFGKKRKPPKKKKKGKPGRSKSGKGNL